MNKVVTVRSLISRLKKLPQNAEVHVLFEAELEGGWCEALHGDLYDIHHEAREGPFQVVILCVKEEDESVQAALSK